MPRRPAELPDDMLSLTADLVVPAIGSADLATLASLADAPPDQFQAAVGRLFRHLAVEGFRTIQAPRNLKELTQVVTLWRKLEGLEGKGSGEAMPAGLVTALRSVQRKQVVDVSPEPEPGEEMPPAFE